MRPPDRRWLAALAICGLALVTCAAPPATPSPTPVATLSLPAPTATITPTPTVTPTPTPVPVDYGPMIEEINRYLGNTADKYGYDLGIGFEDTITGQQISIRGDVRYHAMSSFKGPLAVMYLWRLERGEIVEQPDDEKHLARMLKVSSNEDASCVFERVGGMDRFNDWLADQGLSRQNNFVYRWDEWPCNQLGDPYVPPNDDRYLKGDPLLDLPGNKVLLTCPIPQLPCDKAFAPVELAHFYARLYRGEIIGAAGVERFKGWTKRGPGEAVFLNLLPEGAQAAVYVKGGTREKDEVYRVNFFSEAGLVATPQGAFALAVFMQRNPQWPGTDPMSRVAQIAYSHFTAAHAEKR